jgi:hypothetical protein
MALEVSVEHMQRLFQKQTKAGDPWSVPLAVDWSGRHLVLDRLLQDYLCTQPESAIHSVKSLGAPKVPFESQGLLVISWFMPSLKLEPHAKAYPSKTSVVQPG